jgi:ribosomal subunit interface protein
MNAEVDFRHIEENEHLLAFVSAKTVSTAEHFLEGQQYHIEVKIDTDRSRNATRKPHFMCEVILRIAGHKRAIVIKKTNDNFYQSVSKVSHALKKVLRRMSAKSERHRHDKDFRHFREIPVV